MYAHSTQPHQDCQCTPIFPDNKCKLLGGWSGGHAWPRNAYLVILLYEVPNVHLQSICTEQPYSSSRFFFSFSCSWTFLYACLGYFASIGLHSLYLSCSCSASLGADFCKTYSNSPAWAVKGRWETCMLEKGKLRVFSPHISATGSFPDSVVTGLTVPAPVQTFHGIIPTW